MKITDITESGASNTLMWALANGANIKEDVPLMSLINDETFYIVTLSDVNFFELFRLTQTYRDKLRVVVENQADVPPAKTLKELFPGEYKGEKDTTQLSDIASEVIKNFINLTSQMSTDDDIIQPGVAKMFFPMISRTFTIQIPISFVDVVESMNNEESAKLFNQDYPNTLSEIITSDLHGVKTRLSLGFVKATQIIKYDSRYDKYVKLVKYAPIKTYPESSKLYKFGLVGFSKRNNLTRGEIRCDLFKSNQTLITNCLKQMAMLNTPLELDFAIQIPIQYMQVLENTFGRDSLKISYESSMSSIIDGGLIYNDFETIDYPVNTDDEEGQMKLTEHNNAIEAYRVRITEANQVLLNSITTIITSSSDADVSSTFAMLPSMYTAKAVITVNMDKIDEYISKSKFGISGMFEEMAKIGNGVMADITNSK